MGLVKWYRGFYGNKWAKNQNIHIKRYPSDEDLAILYGVETKVFNQAVKRKISINPWKLEVPKWNLKFG